jgi:hypothetical protein
MRHGLTMGELGHWFIATSGLDVEYRVIEMSGLAARFCARLWLAAGERSWVNPSPNAPNLSMARAYAGTVMLEGTTLSEGRGTTRPLELFGAPDIDAGAIIAKCRTGTALAGRLQIARLLVRADLPQTCRQALQRRADSCRDGALRSRRFSAVALQALAFKAIRRCIRTIRCGATLPMSTSTTGWPST